MKTCPYGGRELSSVGARQGLIGQQRQKLPQDNKARLHEIRIDRLRGVVRMMPQLQRPLIVAPAVEFDGEDAFLREEFGVVAGILVKILRGRGGLQFAVNLPVQFPYLGVFGIHMVVKAVGIPGTGYSIPDFIK